MTTPELYDLNSASGIRQIVTALFLGYNYRLYTEGQTRHELLDSYLRLLEIHKRLPEGSRDEEWIAAVQTEIEKADKNLSLWLLGLTNKTAQNLGVTKTDRINYLREITRHIRQITQDNPQFTFDDAMLLLWAGASTLTVRGSRKSTAGKTLEQAFVRAGLTILGLREDADYWLNMQRDVEVSREIDVEIASRRGRIKLEIGLIGQGNQEVIEDKINRVGPGGIVIFDQIGPKSNAWQTARNQQVGFIQIRNNRPLSELYEILMERVDGQLIAPPSDAADLTATVESLPDGLFLPNIQ